MTELIQFGDLPPEVRREVQWWLAPDVFWDSESRVWAEELFNKRARGDAGVMKLMNEFGQNFVQCHRFMTKRKFTFDYWIFKGGFCTYRYRHSGNPEFDKITLVYDSKAIICTKSIRKGHISLKYLAVDLIMRTVYASHSGVHNEFKVRPDEKLLIEISFESGLWRADFTIGNAEADSKYWIRARDLYEALKSWPFVEVGGAWRLINPRG
jgi:hypothetical protein